MWRVANRLYNADIFLGFGARRLIFLIRIKIVNGFFSTSRGGRIDLYKISS
jgi:hypothetical protein